MGDRLKKVEEPEEREAGRLEEIERRLDVIEELLRRILEQIEVGSRV